MSTVPVEYEIGAPWREMFLDGLRQISQLNARINLAKASIYDAENEIAHLRHAMGVNIGLLQSAEGLPEVVGKYSLSQDGTKLLGQRAVAAAAPVVEVTQDDESDPED